MVFLTSIIIVLILHALPKGGLLYVTIAALVGELMNIYMTHHLTSSVKTKGKLQTKRVADGYRSQLDSKKKMIEELEANRDDSVQKIYNANQTIAKLEKQIQDLQKSLAAQKEAAALQAQAAEEEKPDRPPTLHDFFDDLPSGSNRQRKKFTP